MCVGESDRVEGQCIARLVLLRGVGPCSINIEPVDRASLRYSNVMGEVYRLRYK